MKRPTYDKPILVRMRRLQSGRPVWRVSEWTRYGQLQSEHWSVQDAWHTAGQASDRIIRQRMQTANAQRTQR